MELTQNVWGFTPEGEAVIIYKMTNSRGASVTLTNLGAAIVGIEVPDREGRIADVVLGYKNWESYMGDGAAMGKTVGRYANRIGNGRFTLHGIEYRLARNNGPNHLHGGPTGFANRLWQGRVETNRVVFSYLSADGEENYPGELSVEVVYDWDDDCCLEITLLARSQADTIINLTNHAYFNLAGESFGSVMAHKLRLYADHYLPIDTNQIPTGECLHVNDNPMDFTEAKTIGRDIAADFEPLKIGNGYDHCWVVNGYQDGKVQRVAVLSDEVSGRELQILTDQPGVQVYTGNFLAGTPVSKSGGFYEDRDGVAIECQGFPDAPNHSEFPSQILPAGEIYERKIIYRFGISDS